MTGSTIKELERRIRLRRDATRAPLRAPEWQGGCDAAAAPKHTELRQRPSFFACGQQIGINDIRIALKQQPIHFLNRIPALRFGRF